MGEKDRFLDSPRRISRFQPARQISQAPLLSRKRHQQARLNARADHHHFLRSGHVVDQLVEFPPRRIEARAAPAGGFHARAQIDHDDEIAGAGAEVKQRWVRQCDDQRNCRKNLQEQQNIVAQQPTEPGAERAFFEDALPKKHRRRSDLYASGFEAMEK